MPFAYRSIRGQTTLEYLLLLAVVAVVVIASFGPGSLVSQVHNSAQSYYNTVTNVIMGANPQPINGRWCPVTCPYGSGPNVIYGACECPAPAFGGISCAILAPGNVKCNAGQTCRGEEVSCSGNGTQGSGVTACGSCPTGQSCNSSGQCGCANGNYCSSIPNSSPDSTCTKCLCNNGTYWNNGTCSYCTASSNGQCQTSTDGVSCSSVTCGTNMYCDTTLADSHYNSCQCNAGTYYVGPGCAYCPACQTYNGNACVPIDCSTVPNSSCNSTLSSTDPNYDKCECWLNYCWNGTACVWYKTGGSGICPTCSPGICPTTNGVSNQCGPDTCGNANGCNGPNACPSGQTCNSAGQCVCTSTTCTAAPGSCGISAGTDNCGNACNTATPGTCGGSTSSTCIGATLTPPSGACNYGPVICGTNNTCIDEIWNLNSVCSAACGGVYITTWTNATTGVSEVFDNYCSSPLPGQTCISNQGSPYSYGQGFVVNTGSSCSSPCA